MPASTSPASSPVPAPPTPAAPGPRVAALQKLFADAIAHTLKTCSYPNFSQCFPTPARLAPEPLQGLHAEFIERLATLCHDNFKVILEDRQVVSALNDLDRLVDEARKRKAKAEHAAQSQGQGQGQGQAVRPPTPPHTMPPNSLYLSHLAPSLKSQQDALNLRLQAAQAENAALMQSILQQRQHMDALISTVEAVVGDIDASNTALPLDDVMPLTDEALALDAELTAAR